MRLPLALTVLLLLSACETATVETGIPRFVGKNVSYAIKYLGYPDNQVTVDGKKVYVWQDSFSRTGTVTTYSPQYTTNYSPAGSPTSYSTVAENVPVTLSGECKIRLITKNEKVIDTDLEGNDFGCEKYVDRVQKLIDDTETKITAQKERKK